MQGRALISLLNLTCHDSEILLGPQSIIKLGKILELLFNIPEYIPNCNTV